ncbi:hypothetical protein GCM10027048_28040 [Hymenobacter coalescens]
MCDIIPLTIVGTTAVPAVEADAPARHPHELLSSICQRLHKGRWDYNPSFYRASVAAALYDVLPIWKQMPIDALSCPDPTTGCGFCNDCHTS